MSVPDGHRFLQNGFPHGNSQGSQWPHVVVLPERFGGMDDDEWRRWLYTSCTRAQASLKIAVNRGAK
ncbi:MAG: hypothetical protein EBS48_11435 [Actinobacteria bacterium]|nr:hypothetical protein [Actinomycetota bacterium]